MANVTLLGVDYPDVPIVELPKTGGGVARFVDSANMYPKGTFTITVQFSSVKDGTNYHGLWQLPLGNNYSNVSCQVISQVGTSTCALTNSDITARILSINCVDIYTSVTAAAGKTFNFSITLS